MKRKVFISHKNTGNSNEAGAAIAQKLAELSHDYFLDDTSLVGGMNWNEEIINNLISCDVVIVILDAETAKSDWVQREIDMARAQGISILPVTLENYSTVQPALERFDIAEQQFIHFPAQFNIDKINEAINSIVGRVDDLAEITIKNQTESYNNWLARRQLATPKKTPGDRNPNEVIFTHPKAGNIKFHITSGDASQMKEFDVLVNTENNYMQMARFFEKSTLSYAIRTNGAFFEDGVVLTDDTIQDQLYANAKAKGGLPVRDGRVLVTSAGHKKSRMQRFTDFRYAFHVAAVRVSVKDRSVQPIDDIDRFINNCIEKIETLDLSKGAIELRNGEFLLDGIENYEPIESILFPVFGAGEGGKSLAVAVDEIVKSFASNTRKLVDDLQLSVNKVGLSIYFEEDIELVKQIFLSQNFQEVTS